ncbi:hypothetical protein FRC03_010996 [Tulasnella sp. 419]|nr:hypothetical protein FRC03_010996 [Tulasnella sp. 419]
MKLRPRPLIGINSHFHTRTSFQMTKAYHLMTTDNSIQTVSQRLCRDESHILPDRLPAPRPLTTPFMFRTCRTDPTIQARSKLFTIHELHLGSPAPRHHSESSREVRNGTPVSSPRIVFSRPCSRLAL